MNEMMPFTELPTLTVTQGEGFNYAMEPALAEDFLGKVFTAFQVNGSEPFLQYKLAESVESYGTAIPQELWLSCSGGDIKVLFSSYSGFSIMNHGGNAHRVELTRKVNDILKHMGWAR